MKEIDDTDPPKSESERPEWFERWLIETQMAMIRHLQDQIKRLKTQVKGLRTQVANLETQRTPEMENDDPEWFS